VIFHVTNNMGHLTGMSRNIMLFAAFLKRINQNNHKLVFFNILHFLSSVKSCFLNSTNSDNVFDV